MKPPPPGYTNPPDWLASTIEPIYEELKELLERAHTLAVDEARKRGQSDPERIGVMTLIGMSVQSNLQLLAKGIALMPNDDYGQTATRLSLDVHDSTIITFQQLCQVLADAQTATQQ